MKTSGIIVKAKRSIGDLIDYTLDNGETFTSQAKEGYKVGDKVELTPFMGAVKIKRLD